jgi:DNA mismatch repair protein MutL
MNKRIHALPLQLANQIAAGEVVERPASVLKELVENSIDAGATQIDIQIEGAGSQLIKVTDNGSGIHPQDLPLALSRHATSKLNSKEQLSHIDSLGFRGEALPSIASVSRLTLVSKQKDQDCAWQLNGDGKAPEPAAHPDGTSISVAELFFNLPARRHFLRSDKTELHHLQTCFNRLALSRFDIGFAVRFGDQQNRLPAISDPADYPRRIGKICGSGFIRDARYFDQQFDAIRLRGWVGKRSAHRAQTDVQYFFINGRVIRDRIINHAIRQAYGDALPPGRQPAYLLYLELPLDRVDVNVHPTKHEVRFRDARLVHGLITRAVEEALNDTETAARTQSELPLAGATPSEVRDNQPAYKDHQAKLALSTTGINKPRHSADPLLLLHQRFALVTEPEPALVDLQRADHQLRQQQLQQAIAENRLASRPILVPTPLSLSSQQLALLDQHRQLLEQFAIFYDIKAEQAAIRRIPYLLSQVDLQQLTSAVVECLEINGHDQSALSHTLKSLLPLSPIQSQQQAHDILAQLDIRPSQASSWWQRLDPATLTGLFSN